MTTVPDRSTFESAYTGQAPWDIGRPQKPFLDVADRITGSVLDAGCGTGDNALSFASRGHTVTGIDFLVEPRSPGRGARRPSVVCGRATGDVKGFPGAVRPDQTGGFVSSSRLGHSARLDRSGLQKPDLYGAAQSKPPGVVWLQG